MIIFTKQTTVTNTQTIYQKELILPAFQKPV